MTEVAAIALPGCVVGVVPVWSNCGCRFSGVVPVWSKHDIWSIKCIIFSSSPAAVMVRSADHLCFLPPDVL